MSYTVAKNFKTSNRRFQKDDPIQESDIHADDRVSFDTWVARGFIVKKDVASMFDKESEPVEPEKKGFFKKS